MHVEISNSCSMVCLAGWQAVMSCSRQEQALYSDDPCQDPDPSHTYATL